MRRFRCEHCGELTRDVEGYSGETPAQKSARLRRAARVIRDEQQAYEMAALIRQGETTMQARQKMKIGVIRAQRVRSVAVKLGLLVPYARGLIEGRQT